MQGACTGVNVVGCALTITKHPGIYEPDGDKDFR